MEDFYYAGGLPVVLRALGEHGLLHKDALTANGKTIWENVQDAPCWNREVITPFDEPFKPRRRHRRAARQPRAERRGDQAVRGLARAAEAHAAARWCSRPSRTCTQPSTTRASTSTRPASWC